MPIERAYKQQRGVNMDNFHEEIVVKKNRTLDSLLHGLLSVIMVLLALIAAFSLSSIMAGFSVPTLIMIAVSGGLAFLIFIKKDVLRTEYEYTITNGELDFARVLGNSKRKALGTMNIKNVEALGYVSSRNFNRYASMPGIVKSNWFLNRGANLFYFYYNKDGKKRLIVIEPSEQLAQMIKSHAAYGAYQE